MEISISCPYCGKQMQISLSRTKAKDVICELCGSPLSEEAFKAIKDYKPPSRTGTKSSNSEHVTQSTTFPSSNETPAFPSPTHTPEPAKIQPVRNFPFQVGEARSPISAPSISNEAFLIFPQINQKIKIPTTSSYFHFGRNVILPLVSPSQFDVEWLNSISRVQKQHARVIKEHFKIRRDSAGKFYLEDNQSRWGTWINRQQIKNKGEIPLMNGDKIELMLSKPNTKKVFPFEIIFQC
ncbi:hypothetical protein NEF87_001400 [Candidatus Lokiarchaeum ossiferum]|uniref:FHA domain-containing protein n=1 Tax=Candidatus Lokiarchaeum ossiferum TaxID=2951803 RepID=A0ABY6HNN0_9ARCH|nr:hypothetical protein NEF87_001400 [Candidatus Lokiarchaeum sp. B-35]